MKKWGNRASKCCLTNILLFNNYGFAKIAGDTVGTTPCVIDTYIIPRIVIEQKRDWYCQSRNEENSTATL